VTESLSPTCPQVGSICTILPIYPPTYKIGMIKMIVVKIDVDSSPTEKKRNHLALSMRVKSA